MHTIRPDLWNRTDHSRRALTLIEVMLAVGVFAVLLTSVASGWFMLRTVQKGTQEDAKVHELARALAERIVGANWDWIGRDRPDEMKTIQVIDNSVVPQSTPPTTRSLDITERFWRRYAWSWHRREKPRSSGAKIRLPPLTDHDWLPADYVRFRADTDSPMSALDVDMFDPAQSPDTRINPHNLVDLGVLNQRTGLPNLQVYVEYYFSDALDALFVDPQGGPVVYWNKLVNGEGEQSLIFPESPFPSDPLADQMNPSDSAISQKAMTIRIVVTWGDSPKQRRHELVLARRK